MVERSDIRVSDEDRQVAANRLKAAMDEGRLDLFEYDSRLAEAYQSATYGDLDKLFHDLPPSDRPSERPTEGPGAPAVPRSGWPARRPAPAATGLPLALKILWTIWLAVVSINLVVWTLVSLGNGAPAYFWPMWLLIPGSVLFGVTVGVQHLRRGRVAR